MSQSPYRGRFAPSPTGPLHIGSLIAAMASYLDARAHRGQWLVRMEDLDPPREMPGAAESILRTLEAYGFEWDETVWYQSRRSEIHQLYIDRLLEAGLAFHCGCSRRDIREHAVVIGPEGPIYPGTCRDGLPAGRKPRTVRLRVADTQIHFEDRLQGGQRQNLARELGDFVVRRADGLFAYQLAVVVDDAAQGITDVVRGSDLLSSTLRQCWLQSQLGLTRPRYMHIPVAVNAAGAKLSKQTHAPPLDPTEPVPALWRAAAFLGLEPPPELRMDSTATFWQWARVHWRADKLRGVSAKPESPTENGPV
mgnify:CR=1 FL=1